MYALSCYQHYSIKLDMDHVITIRQMLGKLGYETCMEKMDTFHEGLLLCVSEKSWVLDLFGKLLLSIFV